MVSAQQVVYNTLIQYASVSSGKISDESTLDDELGMDELDMVEALMEISSNLGFEIEESIWLQYGLSRWAVSTGVKMDTVGDWVAYVKSKA